jgi:hypothetical protein
VSEAQKTSDPYPNPDEHCEGMHELWNTGKLPEHVARRHVQEFDASKDTRLAKFKADLLAWMDKKGYP